MASMKIQEEIFAVENFFVKLAVMFVYICLVFTGWLFDTWCMTKGVEFKICHSHPNKRACKQLFLGKIRGSHVLIVNQHLLTCLTFKRVLKQT